MEEKARKIAELLKVLANENRLLILCGLIEKPYSVGALAEKITGISQSALSQHLSLLKAHGIVDCSKNGQSVSYFIADSRIEKVVDVLKDNYCSDD